MNVAKLYNIPIVVSGIPTGSTPHLTPAVREALGEDVKIHVRQTTDSFDDDAIRGAIESTGRKIVLIAGINNRDRGAARCTWWEGTWFQHARRLRRVQWQLETQRRRGDALLEPSWRGLELGSGRHR